jgi:acetylornithine deacetylase/succinyl-diaminopimelate desuccinylase-like protein
LIGSDVRQAIRDQWDASIVPTLCDYIRIPNKSPHFDADWEQHGYMRAAAELLLTWARARRIAGISVELVALPARTPVILCEIPGTGAEGTVLLYGHYDKQPEFSGWAAGLDPWTPVLRDGRLYGRGGADDGYAMFGSLSAIEALDAAGHSRARCIVLIEGCEESGSYDLPHYMDALATRIGTPDLVICLDAECGSYDRLWLTTSLRGLLLGTLSVEVLREGVHSGAASGIVPSSFRVLRQLLDRIEDSNTGSMLDALTVQIPPHVIDQARDFAATLGNALIDRYPWAEGVRPIASDPVELTLNNTWRPTLSVTGFRGAPDVGNAGNTLRPSTQMKLSIRLPPTLDPAIADRAVTQALTNDPPYGARATFDSDGGQSGWSAPAQAKWLMAAVEGASDAAFGKPVRYMGTGGTIPFMQMLGKRFPNVQFLVTGVLGPHSNAHGPNEFLDIETGKRVTECVAAVLAAHATR